MRVFILRLLAVTTISIFIYPPVLVVRIVAFRNDGGVAGFLYYMMLILSGFLVGNFADRKKCVIYDKIIKVPLVKFALFNLDKTKSERNISAVVAYLTSVVPILTTVLFFHSYGIFRVLFEAVFALIPYFISIKGAFRSFADILSNVVAYTGFILISLSMEAAYFFRPALYLKPYLYVISYFYILAYLILKNQEDIDRNIFVKKHVEKSILPKNMRSFNTYAVVVLFAAILLLFNLKSFVMVLLKMTGRIFRYVITAVLWIMNHLNPIGKGEASQVAPPTVNFEFHGVFEIHPFRNFLSHVLQSFILLYTVYHIVMAIIRKAPALISRLAALLRRIFTWKEAEAASKIQDYDEETETVIPRKDHNKYRELRNRIRNAKRELKSIYDPVERIRYIYGSVIGMLGIFGIVIDKSDTTAEIHFKSSTINGIDPPLLQLTESYNLVRYGDCIPDTISLKYVENNYNIIVQFLNQK